MCIIKITIAIIVNAINLFNFQLQYLLPINLHYHQHHLQFIALTIITMIKIINITIVIIIKAFF